MDAIFALIGYGEAASTFARAGDWAGARAFDVRPVDFAGVTAAPSNADAVAGAAVVISLVTADQALAAAQQTAQSIARHALYIDMNSVAPDTKRAAATVMAAAGARYVDAAILAPVNPARLSVPVLLAGEAAADAAVALRSAGFANVRIVGDEIGRASAIKMIRSVMVKGIEALTAEMMLAAAAAGVTDEVLASLDASEKAQGWAARATYNLERMATHGLRRAAEMEESAKTLAALGVEPVMTNGTVQRQRDAAQTDAQKILQKESMS